MPGSGAMRSDVVAVESCTVLLMDVERVLSRCTNSCAFHARLTENLFALLAEKNRILARKADYLAQRTTRQRLLAYLSDARAAATLSDNRATWTDYGQAAGSRKYDHVFFLSGRCVARQFRVLTDDYGAPYISDHYPVKALFGLQK